MINRKFTNQYLKEFDSLTEAIYLCWHNSFCAQTKQINEEKLREQIRSFGFYPFKNKFKNELPLSFRSKLKFKTLTWVNDFTSSMAEESLCESSELYKHTIAEIENNLLRLKNRVERIAYANMILHYLDKSNVHSQDVEESKLNYWLKELFKYLLDHNFITEDNVTNSVNSSNKTYPIYDLTVRLINHFDFIDRLVSSFIFFDISIVFLAEKAKCNLLIFNKCKYDVSSKNDLQTIALPKFKTDLSVECLIRIMHYLLQKKKLINPNVDNWLYWFNLKDINISEPLKWNGSPTLLSNVIQQLCGECIACTVKMAFNTNIFVKPTKNKYERSRMYKEIEQIITISIKKIS
ncbi:MAG: hypothetical protein WCK78_14935 [Paludibacter sp.]